MKKAKKILALILMAVFPLMLSCGGGGGGGGGPAEVASVTFIGTVELSSLLGTSGVAAQSNSIAGYIMAIPASGTSIKVALNLDRSFAIEIETGTPYVLSILDSSSRFVAVFIFNNSTQLVLDESDQSEIDLGSIIIDEENRRATPQNDPVKNGIVSGTPNTNLGEDANQDGVPDIAELVTVEGINIENSEAASPSVDVTGTWSGIITPTGTWSGTPDEECGIGPANITYVLSQSGNTVTGTYSMDGNPFAPIYSGFMSGNTLSITTFPQQMESDDCHLYGVTVTYTVSETTMTLTSASGTLCCGDGMGGHCALYTVTGGSGTLNRL